MNRKPTVIFSISSLAMAKQFYSCNWVRSRVTEEQLNGCVKIGTLSKKNEIQWRVPSPQNPPTPRDGKVVVFADHMGRGSAWIQVFP